MKRIPDSIFKLPLFKGLTPRLAAMVESEAELEVLPAGVTLATQGEYTGRFWFLLDGQVTCYRESDAGQVTRLGNLAPGDWFGEINVLSYRPSIATYETLQPSTFVVLEEALFKQLYQPKRGAFRKLIDIQYREQALAVHLKVAPLFKPLTEEQLKRISPSVTFHDYEKGDVVVSEGEPADALYLVRSGAVKCTRRRDKRILGYAMANSSFGERAYLDSPGDWPGDYEAMATSSLLRIERSAFAHLPELADLVRDNARRIVDEEMGVPPSGDMDSTEHRQQLQMREVMVEGQSVKGGKALVINMDRCIRCNACVESCVSVHDDRVPRLSKAGPRVSQPGGVQFTLASSCYNCEIPECMIACPHGAIRRDANGLIRFEWDNCVGCQSCTKVCPYEVISMTPPPPTADTKPVFKRHWFLRTLPFIGKKFEGSHRVGAEAQPKTDEKVVGKLRGAEVKGKAIKCDLCEGLPFEACVYNCPTQAIWRMSPEDLLAGGEHGTESGLTGARGL